MSEQLLCQNACWHTGHSSNRSACKHVVSCLVTVAVSLAVQRGCTFVWRMAPSWCGVPSWCTQTLRRCVSA